MCVCACEKNQGKEREGGRRGEDNAYDVITTEIDPASKTLSSETTQDPAVIRGHGVKELKGRAERQGLADETGDVGVVGEERGQDVSEGPEEDHVDRADDQGADENHRRRHLGGLGEIGAEQVGDAVRRRDAERHRDLEGQRHEVGQNCLRRQFRGGEVARRERQGLKGKGLGLDHGQSRKSKSNHRAPVLECTKCQAVPAFPGAAEVDVDKQKQGHEIVNHRDGRRSTDVTPVKPLRT